jgi:hypothetical protein
VWRTIAAKRCYSGRSFAAGAKSEQHELGQTVLSGSQVTEVVMIFLCSREGKVIFTLTDPYAAEGTVASDLATRASHSEQAGREWPQQNSR